MKSPRLFSHVRALICVAILIPVVASCASEGSGERAASLDAALGDDASSGAGEGDATVTPDDEESDADSADGADAGDEEIEPSDAGTSDAADEGDGSEQTDTDAGVPGDSGGPDDDAQTADAGPLCALGFADCNSDRVDGCEVDTTMSAQHCSGCGQACSLSNAVPICVASSCAVASCAPSFGNCNADPADGCEVNISFDVRHCGGCNMPCPPRPNSTAVCVNNSCTLAACTPGFLNCNAAVADGCEVNVTNNPAHCGGCGAACALPNATPGCAAQQCTIASCNAGFANCNANAADGCEVDTRSNRLHCGGCNLPCAGALRCVQSSCVP